MTARCPPQGHEGYRQRPLFGGIRELPRDLYAGVETAAHARGGVDHIFCNIVRVVDWLRKGN
jgi:hypothetical protein